MSSPDVGELEEQSVLRAMRGGWIAPLGPDVDAFEACGVQVRDLTRIAGEPVDLERVAQTVDQVEVLLDDEHAVTVLAQVLRDVRADVAGSGDGDAH